jgi:hypothetical protein
LIPQVSSKNKTWQIQRINHQVLNFNEVSRALATINKNFEVLPTKNDTVLILILAGDVSGPSNAVTVVSVGGQAAADIATATTLRHARQHAINSASDHTGFGDSVTKSVGTTAGTVCAGDDARLTANKRWRQWAGV